MSKVWGVQVREGRLIVRASSQKRAVELLRVAGKASMSLHFFRSYAVEIRSNDQDLAAASEDGVWLADDRHSSDREYHREYRRLA